MKIGVIGDTHMPKRAKHLPKALKDGLKGVDLILHTGDWQTLEVYEELQKIAPVDGVAGNVDGEEILTTFGKRKIFTFHGVTIGLTHGDGKGKTTEKRAIEAFSDKGVDIVIFGHSHIPVLKQIDQVTLFNPGSPTDKRRQPKFSYGIIEITDQVKMYHVYYDDKS